MPSETPAQAPRPAPQPVTARRVIPATAAGDLPPLDPLPPPVATPETTAKLDDLPAAEQVMGYAVIGVSDQDIATRLQCDIDLLRERYRIELAVGRARRRITLRQLQWKQANEGTVSILTMLGKCELGQSEAVEPEEEKTIACRTTPLDAAKPPSPEP